MRALACSVCLALAACVPDLPAPGDLAGAAALADDIDDAALMPAVEALAAAHLGDVKRSCEGYPEMDRYPTCELSSTASATWVFDALSRITGSGSRAAISAWRWQATA